MRQTTAEQNTATCILCVCKAHGNVSEYTLR